MPRPILWGALGALALVAAFAFGMLLTEGGLFTRARNEWTVDVQPRGPGEWTVEVPRLVAGAASMERAQLLADLLAKLRVTAGSATFELAPGGLVIRGDGSAILSAVQTAPRGTEGFADWSVSGMDTASGEGSPTLDITWRVDLSGGGGHTCWASGTWSATIEPGTRSPLVQPGPRPPPGIASSRPWAVVCA